ncbi:hypothetical protein BGZ80_008774, partial [Entomortierella chlamydospora]
MSMQSQMRMQMQQQRQQQQLLNQQYPQPLGFSQPPIQNSVTFSPQTYQPSTHLYQTFQQQPGQSVGGGSVGGVNGNNPILTTSNPQGITNLSYVGNGLNPQPPPSLSKKDIWAAQQANLQAQLNKNNLNAGMIAEGGKDRDVASTKKLQQMFQYQQQQTNFSTPDSSAGSAGSTPSRTIVSEANAPATPTGGGSASTSTPSSAIGSSVSASGATSNVTVSVAAPLGSIASSIPSIPPIPFVSTTTNNSPMAAVNGPASPATVSTNSSGSWTGMSSVTSSAFNTPTLGLQPPV